MLTVFAVPKAFQGHNAVIQRNAIQSWTRLGLRCDVILCGDDFGSEETAREFGVGFIPKIERNQLGTPLINSVFEQVKSATATSLLCYVNADIILLGGFMAAMQSVRFRDFLMIGQRWDLDISEPINFEANRWEDHLKTLVAERGSLHPPTGIDYFVFPRQINWSMPPFAVGRPGWDNWLVCRAREMGLPVVDATRATTVVHQNHDYAHVKLSTDGASEGPEADENRRLIGGWEYFFTIRDATHRLTSGKIESSSDPFRLKRKLTALPVPAVRFGKRLNYVAGAAMRALRSAATAGA